MKKKVLTIAVVAALAAIMVSGTLAYFTANDEVTNTFTIGSVLIDIYENDNLTPDDTLAFTEPLTPIVNVETPSNDESYIKKVVKVKNTGLNDAYIRVHLAIPTSLVDYLVLDVDDSVWTKVATTTATYNNVAYTVYTYDYTNAVASGDFTPELLKGVYLASDVDLKADIDGNLWFVKKTDGEITDESGFLAHKKTETGYTSTTVNVLVYAQAIQAQGFENGATSALNSGFGTNTNPWQ